jgi:large subunit ribosomal protein L25
MISLTVKSRKESGKKVKSLRGKGILPGVLYGPKIESQNVEMSQKEFDKVYRAAGESSLISLDFDKKKFIALIHQVQLDPITLMPVHVDFLQPSLTEEISVKVPLIFEGEAPAIKELGGTFVKNISEIEVKALPEKLPHEIKVDVTSMKTFEDSISIKDLILPEGVKIITGQDDIIAFVASPEKIEEELEKPIEEKVEEVEKIEKAKKEEETEETKEEAKRPAK